MPSLHPLVRRQVGDVLAVEDDLALRAPCAARRSSCSVVVLPAPLAPISVATSPSLDPERDVADRLDVAVVDAQALDLKKHRLVHSQVGRDHGGVVADLGGRALGDLAAELQHDDPVGDAHDQPHVVLDQQHGVALVADLADQVHQLRLLGRVEAGGRLVEAQQLRARSPSRGRSRAGAGRRRRGSRPARRRARRRRRTRAAPSPRPCASRLGRGGARGVRNSALSSPTLLLASAPTMTFSRAVIDLNSRMFWNVRAMPELGDLVPLQLRQRRCPSNRIWPLVAW